MNSQRVNQFITPSTTRTKNKHEGKRGIWHLQPILAIIMQYLPLEDFLNLVTINKYWKRTARKARSHPIHTIDTTKTPTFVEPRFYSKIVFWKNVLNRYYTIKEIHLSFPKNEGTQIFLQHLRKKARMRMLQHIERMHIELPLHAEVIKDNIAEPLLNFMKEKMALYDSSNRNDIREIDHDHPPKGKHHFLVKRQWIYRDVDVTTCHFSIYFHKTYDEVKRIHKQSQSCYMLSPTLLTGDDAINYFQGILNDISFSATINTYEHARIVLNKNISLVPFHKLSFKRADIFSIFRQEDLRELAFHCPLNNKVQLTAPTKINTLELERVNVATLEKLLLQTPALEHLKIHAFEKESSIDIKLPPHLKSISLPGNANEVIKHVTGPLTKLTLNALDHYNTISQFTTTLNTLELYYPLNTFQVHQLSTFSKLTSLTLFLNSDVKLFLHHDTLATLFIESTFALELTTNTPSLEHLRIHAKEAKLSCTSHRLNTAHLDVTKLDELILQLDVILNTLIVHIPSQIHPPYLILPRLCKLHAPAFLFELMDSKSLSTLQTLHISWMLNSKISDKQLNLCPNLMTLHCLVDIDYRLHDPPMKLLHRLTINQPHLEFLPPSLRNTVKTLTLKERCVLTSDTIDHLRKMKNLLHLDLTCVSLPDDRVNLIFVSLQHLALASSSNFQSINLPKLMTARFTNGAAMQQFFQCVSSPLTNLTNVIVDDELSIAHYTTLVSYVERYDLSISFMVNQASIRFYPCKYIHVHSFF
mmetsp:Transcript_702/g.1097  ORF Transcript_702/g.1097 Transcript_702/m.1097 type:complete len:757 (+) Transcript_702:90-2360(+)